MCVIISYFRAYFRNYAGMSTHSFSILTGNSEWPPGAMDVIFPRPHLEALVRLISPFFMISQYFLSHGQGSVGNWRPFAWATAADKGNFGDAGVNVLSPTQNHAFLCRWIGKRYYVAVPQRYVCFLGGPIT